MEKYSNSKETMLEVYFTFQNQVGKERVFLQASKNQIMSTFFGLLNSFLIVEIFKKETDFSKTV